METIYTVTVNEGGTFWENKEGQFHRLGGLPAVERADGSKFYYENGKRHRLGGPAIDQASGYKEWWINGKHLDCNTQKEFEQLMKLKAFW